MNNFATPIIIISILVLVIAIGLFLWHRSQFTYETIELDENDPEYKRLAEARNDLLSSIFEHLSINLGISTEQINDTCEIVNVSPELTTVKFASTDTICRMACYWDKYIKITLFNNRKLQGKVVQSKKIFRVKDNAVSAKALTRFAIKFRNKAFGDNKIKIQDLEVGCIQVAKDLAEKMDVEKLKEAFVDTVLNTDLTEYKRPKESARLYAFTYAIMIKFCEKQLLEALQDEEKDEKEPE